jgi:hypothetical protein
MSHKDNKLPPYISFAHTDTRNRASVNIAEEMDIAIKITYRHGETK